MTVTSSSSMFISIAANSSSELEDGITFSEFEMWLQGLIEGKNGALPDFDDWKRIKEMMDRVVPDVQEIVSPAPVDLYRLYPTYPYVGPTWVTPNTIPCNTPTITYTDSAGNRKDVTSGYVTVYGNECTIMHKGKKNG